MKRRRTLIILNGALLMLLAAVTLAPASSAQRAARARGEYTMVAGKIIGGIIESIWTTLTCLLLPCIIIEDAGFGQAMKRVRALHKGHLLLVGVGEVGVRGITNLIGFLWFSLLFVLEFYVIAKIFTGSTLFVVAVTVGGTMFSLFVAFSTYLRMAYYTCLYQWAVAVEKEGQSAPAPLPLAIALGHTTYTKAA